MGKSIGRTREPPCGRRRRQRRLYTPDQDADRRTDTLSVAILVAAWDGEIALRRQSSPTRGDGMTYGRIVRLGCTLTGSFLLAACTATSPGGGSLPLGVRQGILLPGPAAAPVHLSGHYYARLVFVIGPCDKVSFVLVGQAPDQSALPDVTLQAGAALDLPLGNYHVERRGDPHNAVSYTHLTLPTKRIV